MDENQASTHELHILGIKQEHEKAEQHAGILCLRKM
jgi:hypothetical protein